MIHLHSPRFYTLQMLDLEYSKPHQWKFFSRIYISKVTTTDRAGSIETKGKEISRKQIPSSRLSAGFIFQCIDIRFAYRQGFENRPLGLPSARQPTRVADWEVEETSSGFSAAPPGPLSLTPSSKTFEPRPDVRANTDYNGR